MEKQNKKVVKSEYDIQADSFLEKTGATIESEYTGHRLYFDGDKDHRATFKVTIKRGDKSMSFDFGNSVMDSWSLRGRDIGDYKRGLDGKQPLAQGAINFRSVGEATRANKETKDSHFTVVKRLTAPSNYDILACLDSYDTGTLNDWCDNYGYSTDSVKARDLYFKCQNQYDDLCRLFNSEEMEELREIQ